MALLPLPFDDTDPAVPTLVLFHMNGCGHCDAMMPDFDEATLKLARTMPDLAILKVEETQLTSDIANRYSVRGFPTLVLIFPGEWFTKPTAANPARTTAGILEFVAGACRKGPPTPTDRR